MQSINTKQAVIVLNVEYSLPRLKGKRKLSFSHKTSLTKTIEKRGFGKGNFNFEYGYQSGNSKLPV